MKYLKPFNESIQSGPNFPTTTKEVDVLCEKYGINSYIINQDLSIDCFADVNLSSKGLKYLPLKFNRVEGRFKCSSNRLVSLEGSPRYIRGVFECNSNQLTTLVGGPEEVYVYNCIHNKLTNLIGCPEGIIHFSCGFNNISSLEGCPKELSSFECDNNPLYSLDYFPECYNYDFDKCPVDNLIMKLNIFSIKAFKTTNYMKKLSEKLEEFEVIKEKSIDLISLNSLYDYYNAEFNSDNFRRVTGYSVIE